ncbi:MAG: Phosphatidylinositol 3,5-bisphosphate-binding protein [Alyxoria varia]|nr:MAG: Phosphatidylinositol 3,5-bisphosphate-binding protein [Alyxoria varia]
MTQTYIAIVCERSVRIYRYKFADGAREFTIAKVATYETSLNSLGLCCLRAEHCVFPGRSKGQITLVDLATAADDILPDDSKKASGTSRNNVVPNVNIIPAHNAALRAMNLTSDGTIVASASETGTIIRLYHTPTQARLAEFRRGVQTATIYSLAFSPSSSHLAITSDTNTLHVFAVSGKTGNPKDANESAASASPSKSPSKLDRSSANATSQSWAKWPTLSKIPFAPRVFSDVYSIATCPFDPGAKGMDGGQTPKGVVGWTDDETLVVLSAGRDARYERFAFEVGGTTSGTSKLHATSIGDVQQTGGGGFADASVGSAETVPAKVWRIGWMRFMRPN